MTALSRLRAHAAAHPEIAADVEAVGRVVEAAERITGMSALADYPPISEQGDHNARRCPFCGKTDDCGRGRGDAHLSTCDYIALCISVRAITAPVAERGETREEAIDPIEVAAQALVNADLDCFGSCWPWPIGDTDDDQLARANARAVAATVIRAYDAAPAGEKWPKINMRYERRLDETDEDFKARVRAALAGERKP